MIQVLDFFKKKSLANRLQKIIKGDTAEREALIQEYIPFIIKTISSVTNRYVESENSEEYSIGLEAFNEAIDKFEKSKGSFISFAELVIKSRIYDYLRKMKKYSTTTPMSQFKQEEQEQIKHRFKEKDFTEDMILKEEIKTLEKNLKGFNITFEDLVKDAPKHKDTRQNALRIASYIAKDTELKNELIRKKNLPASKLIENLKITSKVLKGSRKFIIATVLILDEDLDLLKNYIKVDEGGGVDGI